MKNTLTLLFILLLSSISFAQNSDKLTLKGGVMLGVPKTKTQETNYVNNRRGMCPECPPEHTGVMKYHPTLNFFTGVEYFPWKIQLSEKVTYLLPFTSLNFLTSSQSVEYKIEDLNNNSYKGQYTIRHFSSGMSFGVKLALEQYKLDFLLSTNALFFSYFSRSRVVKYEYDTEPFYNFDNIGNNNNSFTSIVFPRPFPNNVNIDVRYKLNHVISANLGFSLINLYRSYHQISLGVTYQLLSHKNKKVEKTEQ